VPEPKLIMEAEGFLEILHRAYDLGASRGVTVFCRTVLGHGGVPPAGAFDKALGDQRAKDLGEFEKQMQAEIERLKKKEK
jgi:hypothetical protein